MNWTGLKILAATAAFVPGLAAAQMPAANPVTPDLVQKATAEGKVVFYTAADLPLSEAMAKAFEAKYPGIKVQIERTGSERVFQRVGQEYTARIYQVDVVNSSDAAHFIVWKRDNWLAPWVPEDVSAHFGKDDVDKDGMYATWRTTLSPFFYNTNLLKAEEAPKSFQDLLDPRWKGKLVKGHPGYSGTVMTSTYQTMTAIGWDFFEKLSKQDVLQVQSALEPPRKVAGGERVVGIDGSEYLAHMLIDRGNPLKIVYPAEGTPMVTSPSAVMKNAPNPNAARLLQSFMFSRDVQQMLVDIGGLRSMHKQVVPSKNHVPMDKIKLLPEDAGAVEKAAEQIKRRYRQAFGT